MTGTTGAEDRNQRQYRWQRFQHRFDDYAEYVLLAVPLLILFLVLGLPVVFNIYISFFEWNGTGWPEEFVALAHYSTILEEPEMVRSTINTALWTVMMVTVPPAVGLGIALLINDLSLESLYKTAFFLPYAISFVAIGIMWRLMYNGDFGVINEILRIVGLGGFARSWMGIPWINTFAMMVAHGWLFAAFAMYRIAFSQFNFGRGAAVANVLTVLIVVATVVYIRYNIRREVEY